MQWTSEHVTGGSVDSITTSSHEKPEMKCDYLHSCGVVTPNYFKLVRSGALLPMTRWDQYSLKYTREGSLNVEYRDHTNNGFNNFAAPFYWNESRVKQAPIMGRTVLRSFCEGKLPHSDKYIQAALASMYSSGWDALTFIVELRKTADLFRGFVKRFVSLIRSGRIEQLWLEGRYGWRVLIYDMIDIEKAIRSLDDQRTRLKERRGGTISEWSEDLSGATTMYTTNDYYVTSQVNVKVEARGNVIADMKPPAVTFNPLVTTWEVITFSFIVDWVLSVGRFLEAMSALAVSNGHVSAGGIKYTRTTTSSGVWTPSAGYSGSITSSEQVTEEYILRSPRSVRYTPLIDLNFDFLKMRDILAIMKSAVK